jgi:hypothetical protein
MGSPPAVQSPLRRGARELHEWEEAPYPPLQGLRDEVSGELQLFEQSVCHTMERISGLAMTSVQKKFIGMDAAEKGTQLYHPIPLQPSHLYFILSIHNYYLM